jgi:hypothetical protein
MLAFFHSPSKKMVQRFCTSVGRNWADLKNETTFAYVSGCFGADCAAPFVRSAANAGMLRNKMKTQQALVVNIFIFVYWN